METKKIHHLKDAFLVVLLAGTMSAAAAAPVFNVRDFGAKSDNTSDDGPAIKQAIQLGIAAGSGAEVFFPKGTYHLISSIELQNADGLTLRGETGTLLVMGNADSPIVNIRDCNHLTILSLSFDRDPLSFTQGTIDGVDPTGLSCDLTIDPGYPAPDASWLVEVKQELHPFIYPESGTYQLDRYAPEIVNRERTGERKWHFTLKGSALMPSCAGKRFLIWAAARGHCFVARGLQDCLIEDVNYWGGGGNAGLYLKGLSGTNTFRRFVIGVPPRSDRLLSCLGGGQISNVRGHLLFEECDFSKIDDDGLDILGSWVRVLEQKDMRTVVVQEDRDFRVGDHAALWDWNLKASRAEAVIVSVSKAADSSVAVSFDRDVQIQRAGAGDGQPFGTAARVDGIDRLINLDSVGEQTIIRNCKFQVFRAKCLNLKAKNCLVEGCTFRQSWQPAISAAPEWYFQEGPPIRHLIVRNNTFSNINHTNIQVGAAVKESNNVAPASDSSRDTANVVIEDNRFVGYGAHSSVFNNWPPGIAVRVQCATDVIIRRNDFGDPAQGAPKNVEKVRVENSDNVVLEADNRHLK
jgi:hypothetical protein